MFSRKSWGTLLVCLLSLNQVVEINRQVSAIEYQKYMNPGIQVRLEEQTINQMKKAMTRFLPRFFNSDDIDLPKEYEFHFTLFLEFLTWQYKLTNIEYYNATLDIHDVQIELTDEDLPMLKFNFPAIELWHIKAHLEDNSWILPNESDIVIVIEDLDLNINTDFQLDDHGFLDPVIYNVNIDFGETSIYHENQFISFIIHEFVTLFLVIVQNATYFLGTRIGGLLGSLMDKGLNHYTTQLYIPSPLLGQETSGKFSFDFRNVYAPSIRNDYMDIYIVGELIHGEHECALEPDYLKFANSDVYSQIVISESAMTCAMNQMAHSPIGYIQLNQEKANALLKKDNVDFDTSYFADFFPIFEKRLGPNKPFKIELDFKNINVLLGQYDTDLIFEYTLGIKFKLDALGAKELLYDEFRMITSMDMEAENESLFIKLLVNKIDTDAKYATKEMPLRNSIDMSVSEYREFLASFSYSMNYLKGYLNEQVLEAGITFPFRFNEFDSKLEFLEKQMHILLEVNDMAYMFFDDEFLSE